MIISIKKAALIIAISGTLYPFSLTNAKQYNSISKETIPFQDGKVYPFSELDEKPEFPGGLANFHDIISKRIRIPSNARAGNHKVFVSFTIETDGSMANFKVLRDTDIKMGDDILAILKNIKEKWTPGKIGESYVRTSLALPVLINVPEVRKQ